MNGCGGGEPHLIHSSTMEADAKPREAGSIVEIMLNLKVNEQGK